MAEFVTIIQYKTFIFIEYSYINIYSYSNCFWYTIASLTGLWVTVTLHK